MAAGARPERSSPLDVDAMLTLAPGKYELRADAKSRSGARSGNAVLALDVPDFSAQPLQVSDLVLGSSGNPRGWSGSRTVTGGAPPIWPFHPEISREFSSTDDVRLYAEIARANPASRVDASAEDPRSRGEDRRSTDANDCRGCARCDRRHPHARVAGARPLPRSCHGDAGSQHRHARRRLCREMTSVWLRPSNLTMISVRRCSSAG